MKITKLMVLVLVGAASLSRGSSEHGTNRCPHDSLAEETATLDKIVQKLSKFKVSAYIQGQFQYGQGGCNPESRR